VYFDPDNHADQEKMEYALYHFQWEDVIVAES
jgi:hypothetical protein